MTIKDRYEKILDDFIQNNEAIYADCSYKGDRLLISIADVKTILSRCAKSEPDVEAIKKKWKKRLKPIESNAITATAQQIEIYKRQQEIGYQKAAKEILSDLGEKWK